MWTQIVGKVRLALSPHLNHWWEVPLYVTARGLTTSPIPYSGRIFEIQFDFVTHNLEISVSDGRVRYIPLYPRSVADFYAQFMAVLESLGIRVKIWPVPVEVENPIPFDKDLQHNSYDPEYAHRFWQVLVHLDTALKKFRARFLGKVSPVHFFWGSFDLTVTRFSGRPAPPKENADPVTRDAYSHEVSSAGFWPGGGPVKDAALYSYAAPEPPGFKTAQVRPSSAFYDTGMGEFLLMYEDVRKAASPEDMLLEFFQTAYEAAANAGKWDRKALEIAAD